MGSFLNFFKIKYVLFCLAAHCIKPKYTTYSVTANDLNVFLGRYDLNLRHERGSQHEEVSEIIIHPDWRRNDIPYDSDVALIALKRTIQFSMFIMPVCFPASDDLNSLLVDTTGTIVN